MFYVKVGISSRLRTCLLYTKSTSNVLRTVGIGNAQIFNNSCSPRPVCNCVRKLNSKTIQVVTNNNYTNLGHYVKFSSKSPTEEIDSVTYESICEETLDSLCEFFEDVIEKIPLLKTADVSYGDGVLTVNLDKFGTYVINRQSPNKQIWLSSPTSGPKRYDFVQSRNGWVYRHNNQTLHSLLQKELATITKTSIDLSNCTYCGDFK